MSTSASTHYTNLNRELKRDTGGIRVRVRSMTAWVRIATLVVALATACPSIAQKHPEEHPQKKQQPQHHAGEWLRQHRNLPPEQQRKALENDPQFRNLPRNGSNNCATSCSGSTAYRRKSNSKC